MYMCIELCTHGEVKLHSGSSKLNGNVIVCINGTWSYICGHGNTVINDILASVICSTLDILNMVVTTSACACDNHYL